MSEFVNLVTDRDSDSKPLGGLVVHIDFAISLISRGLIVYDDEAYIWRINDKIRT